MIPVRGTILLLVLLARSPGPVIAQDHGVRHGFWAGLDLGYGSLRRSSIKSQPGVTIPSLSPLSSALR